MPMALAPCSPSPQRAWASHSSNLPRKCGSAWTSRINIEAPRELDSSRHGQQAGLVRHRFPPFAPLLDPRPELVRFERLGDEIALRDVAAQIAQQPQLFLGFN